MQPSIPFPDLTGCKIFPSLENDTFEFKASLDSMCLAKVLPTICGFLNHKGGHMVFGVTDKGVVKGVHGSRDRIDTTLLSFDNIIHQKQITYDDGERMAPQSISSRVIGLPSGLHLIVLTATPELGRKYMCADGSSWHRLSASNYRIRDQSVRSELEAMRAKYDSARAMIQSMREDSKQLLGAAKAAEAAAATAQQLAAKTTADLQVVLSMLKTDILKKKELVEMEHEGAARSCSWWKSLTCGLF